MCTENAFRSTFARVEKKYILTPTQAETIIAALGGRGFRENIYGSPLIQSIYYDTPDHLLVRRSVERPGYKEKLRLRTYGDADPASPAWAEIKKKVNGIVYKRRTGLPLAQAASAMASGRLPEENGQIAREIEWFIRCYPGLRPACLIAYERRAFEQPAEGLRLTFDADVRFRGRDFDLTLPAAGTPLLGPGEILMEVKVPGAYPLWLTGLIWQVGARPVHFSKYGTAWVRHIRPGLSPEPRSLFRRTLANTEVRHSA